MAKRGKSRQGGKRRLRFRPFRWLWRWGGRLLLAVVAVAILVIAAHRQFPPPDTLYMRQEARRLDGITHEWVPLDAVAPVMARAVVAAEDANFCRHWGFDMAAIRNAIEDGAVRGASTLSQQVVKNVYLWHGRSWLRKALEALITPVVEALWPKRRIVEVYLNVAEFDTGVFGVAAAARQYFDVDASQLTAVQAARLAALLPDPKGRSAANPSAWLRTRAAAIMDGAATIRRDGRAACFED
ncbi:monofunctional biosynthetic peptidoglycan transglycosylase [Roseovarius sp. SYSU LYC5161]|uniref:monofunctional biosynthetic peptidoglycan transglycosylase n=1 Tax=Roseovarius halophilus (ex Wu et al. 2025) TaxID=3376060 RepID=UPI002872833C|nr:monofunctional biosynthetic peptidoglycan transglycosylase [Roseovarius sp.]